MAVKAPGTTSNSDQKRGQKRGAGDLFSDVAGLEPTGDREQAPPVKRGKPFLKPNEQATGHSVPRSAGKGIQGQTKRGTAAEVESQVRGGDNARSGVAKRQTVASNDVDTDTDGNLPVETPCRPAKKVKTQGIQCTGMFTHNSSLGDMVDVNIYLETMITLDGPNLIVRHSDDTVAVRSGDDGLDVGPHQPDFRADEISGESDGDPAGVPSEDGDRTWPTPSALEKGHSFRGGFEGDTDGDSDPESEHAKRSLGERGEYNRTTGVVRHIRSKFGLLFIDMLI